MHASRRIWSLVLLLSGAVLCLTPSTATEPSAPTWIVTYDAPPSAYQIEALEGVALQVHPYQHLPAATVVAPTTEYALIANLPGVLAVYPNRTLKTVLAQSTGAINAPGVWADGYTGAGIGIAIVDAGVDGTHPDLCAAVEFCNGTDIKTVQNVKILGNQQFLDPVVVLEDQISTDSSSGHGSHVAGIAAGAGTASETPGKYRGVAHGAKIIGLGTGEVLEVVTVLAAWDWILANHSNPAYNIKVVNNSWGPGAGAQYDPNEPVQRGIAALHDAGMAVVFGAGNDGPKTGTINIFSANPKAISAAASAKSGHTALFSSRGVPGSPLLRPTVTTPGQFIASVRARTGFYADVADATGPDFNNPILPPDDLSYGFASGTSMSAPHVAGTIALMQQAAFMNLGRYLTPAEVRNVLQNTAVSQDPVGGPGGLPYYQGYTQGAGTVDALAAVRSIAAGTNLQTYNDTVVEDVRTFKGVIAGSAVFVTSSFETTYTVAPGAVSLDVMIDWQHGAQNAAAQDLDIDLFRPDGSLYLSTTLMLGLTEGPNQYSSAFTNQPNERLNVVAAEAGTWRAVVHGTVSANETAYGLWSVVYPDGTVLAPAQSASNVVVTVPATPGIAGQTVNVTATVTDASGFPVANTTVSWTSAGVGSVKTAETLTDERGMTLATLQADSLGTQTVTATSGSASGSASVMWIGLPPVTVPPPPSSTPGKASGGGHISNPSRKNFGFFAEYTAQSSAPGGDLSFDDKNGMKVKATAMGSLTISGNAATVEGDASVNGVGGYRFTLDVVDNGEPGSSDTFRLRLTQPSNPMYSYDTSGTLSGGNIQVEAY